jgi:hypothetical protein
MRPKCSPASDDARGGQDCPQVQNLLCIRTSPSALPRERHGTMGACSRCPAVPGWTSAADPAAEHPQLGGQRPGRLRRRFAMAPRPWTRASELLP